MATDTVQIDVTCHCRLFAQTLHIPADALPLKSALCSCNSCRHISGHIFATFAVMPIPFPTNPAFFNGLTKYQSTKNLERWFCGGCGASICNYDRSDAEWEFCTGAIDTLGDTEAGKGCLDGRLKRALLWFSDTRDGGALHWLNEGKPDGLEGRYAKGRDELLTDAQIAEMEAYSENMLCSGQADTLSCQCHCGKVKFDILARELRQKYGGILCACTSCRKTSGFEITSWIHVRLQDQKLDTESMSVGCYSSSEGRQRYFCKYCGATLQFRADVIETAAVATGLIDPDLGARVVPWVEWSARTVGVCAQEDATDKEFVAKLAKGMQTNLQVVAT